MFETVSDADCDGPADLTRAIFITADASSVLQAQDVGHFPQGKAEALAVIRPLDRALSALNRPGASVSGSGF